MLLLTLTRHEVIIASTLLMVLLVSTTARVNAFSEQLDAAEEEHLYDDRTLLDIFGEVAKEYFTKSVVSRYTVLVEGQLVLHAFESANNLRFRYQRQMKHADGTGDMHGASPIVDVGWSSCGATIT
jgi:hypothetical protein